MPGPPPRQHKQERQYTPSTHSIIPTRRIWNDDYGGQMISGDLVGLKFPDICLTGEEKPRKKPPRKPVPTGDRTRARCVTSAHATPFSTAVDSSGFVSQKTYKESHVVRKPRFGLSYSKLRVYETCSGLAKPGTSYCNGTPNYLQLTLKVRQLAGYYFKSNYFNWKLNYWNYWRTTFVFRIENYD